jgi:hypothetical protein
MFRIAGSSNGTDTATVGAALNVSTTVVGVGLVAAFTVIVGVDVSNHAGVPFKTTGCVNVTVIELPLGVPRLGTSGVRVPIRFAAFCEPAALRRLTVFGYFFCAGIARVSFFLGRCFRSLERVGARLMRF